MPTTIDTEDATITLDDSERTRCEVWGLKHDD